MAPITKKRRYASVEEITFDESAREQYLTGFHKRKQQRIKHAQEIAAKRERDERIVERRQVRPSRSSMELILCSLCVLDARAKATAAGRAY